MKSKIQKPDTVPVQKHGTVLNPQGAENAQGRGRTHGPNALLWRLAYSVVWVILLLCLAQNTWALAIGNRVQANSNLNVRSTPAGTLLGTQSSGALGTIIGGPQTATLGGTSFVWWQVNWDSGPDGWSVADGLTIVVSSPGSFTLSNDAPVWDTNPPPAPAVQLRWTASSNATSYEVYRNGTKIYPTSGTYTGTTFYNNAGLTSGQTYSYYILAKNSAGSTQSNTINVGPMPSAPTPVPTTPGGTTPGTVGAPGPVQASASVTLSWSASAGATYYSLGVRNMVTNVLVVDTTTTNTSYPASLAANGQYRWNVAACNASGCSSFTTPLYFQTPAAALSLPTLISPGEAINSPHTAIPYSSIKFNWNKNNTGATYNLYVRDITGFADDVGTTSGTLVINGQNVGDVSSYTWTGAQASKKYRWQVEAVKSGSTSVLSDKLVFVTQAAPVTLQVNGFLSSYSTTTTPYQPTINLTGSGFNSVTQISWSCTMPNGTSCTGSPYVWTSANWSGKFSVTSDTVASVSPVLVASGDPGGTYNWTVTFSGAGQSVTKSFTVTYTPPTNGGGFFLSFPLSGYTAYTVPISSVFDHSMKARYATDTPRVTVFTGEYGDQIDFIESPQPPYSFKKPVATPADQQPFGMNVINYQGTNLSGPTTINYQGHPGYDFKVDSANVYAAADGWVETANENAQDPAGKYVRLQHDPAGYQTQYLHLSELKVSQGATVTRGQWIGVSGNTGNSTGAHLHFEIKKQVGSSWVAVDPYGWSGSGTDPYVANGNPESVSLWNSGEVDYPGSISDPAHPYNYTTASRTAANIRWVVIHTTEDAPGSDCSTTRDFFRTSNNPISTANNHQGRSAHYVICRDGTVVQMVRDNDIAHHAGNFSYNENSIGIEHERHDTSNWTEAQFQASAALVKWLATQYDILLVFPSGIAPANPASGTGIIGHIQVPDPSNPALGGGAGHHTDPVNWDWTHYQQLFDVQTDTTPPTISAFNVTPASINIGANFTISYTVSDSGGSGLNHVVLRRTSGDGSAFDPGWHDISTNPVSGNGPVGGSFSDIPPSVETYWYGVAAFDNQGNSKDERQAGLGPIQRTVTPRITVTSPNGGEIWQAGTTHNITWTSAGVTGNVRIRLAFNSFPQSPDIASSVPNSGSYSWTIPASQFPGSAYEIAIDAVTGAGFDISDSDFTIVPPSDTTPDAFSFTPQTGVALNTAVTSNTITVSGINAAASISITGGNYSINGGAFTTASGTVNNGNTVAVRLTSSGSYSTQTCATLTIGGVSGQFCATTQAPPVDTTPDAFSFTSQTGVALNTAVTSNTITVSGINAAASISITGGNYSINGGAFTTASGTVNNGNTVAVRLTSSGSYSTQTCATLNIGGVQGSFCATTVNPAFDYTLSNTGNITVTQGSSGSNTITRNLVSGSSQAVTLSATGLPSGATPSFSNNPCNPTCLSTLTISTSASTPTGTFPITVSGSPLNKSTSFNLVVNAQVTFSTSDLAGTWRVYSLDASGIEGEAGGWSKGTLTVDTTGTVTAGSLTEASGGVTAISNGLLSITEDGHIIGDLTGTPGPDLIELNATLLPDKDVIIGVATNQWIDGSKSGVSHSLFAAAKETGAVFAQSDLTDIWRLYLLSTPETPGEEGTRSYGSLSIDGSGVVSGSISQYEKSFVITGGTLTLGADGYLTGTLNLQSDTESQTATIQATMFPDKNMVVGVSTTEWVEGAATGQSFDLFFSARAATQAQTFSQADLEGSWRVYDLDVSSTEGNLGAWKVGTLTLDSNGLVINGSVVDAEGNGTTVTGGPLTLNTSGVITGILAGSPGPDSITVNATMVLSKEMIVGVTTVDWVDGTETGKDYGLFALIKEATSNPQPGDITGPTNVQVAAPSNRQTISGTFTLKGTAQDNSGTIQKMEFYIDDTTLACSDNVPKPAGSTFQCNWDTKNKPNGPHMVKAKAYDGSGNPSALSSSVPFTINNPLPAISINDAPAVTEGLNANFTVSLSEPSSQPVTVKFATANGTAKSGSDYVGKSGTLTFNPGETSKTITVAVKGDTLHEGDETFFVNLSTPTSAILNKKKGVGTIVNDDPRPTISISDATKTEGNSGTVNAVFTVSLSAPSGLTVKVKFATANGTATAGSDYVAKSGTLSFSPGQTSKNITIAVIGDTVDEPNETFFVNLSNATNATIADSQGVGTIIDND